MTRHAPISPFCTAQPVCAKDDPTAPIGGSFARLPPAPTTLCYLGLSATRAIGLLSVAPRRLADQGGEGPPSTSYRHPYSRSTTYLIAEECALSQTRRPGHYHPPGVRRYSIQRLLSWSQICWYSSNMLRSFDSSRWSGWLAGNVISKLVAQPIKLVLRLLHEHPPRAPCEKGLQTVNRRDDGHQRKRDTSPDIEVLQA